MALPLLLPLLGLGAAAGVGQARQRQQQVQQREARQQRASDVQATLQGAGMQFGPRIGTTPQEQQQLAGTVQALNSPFPDLQAQGMAQVEQRAPMAMAKLEQTRLQNEQLMLQNAAMRNPQTQQDPKFVASTAKNLFDSRRADLLPYANNLQNFRELTAILAQGGGPASMAATFKFIQGLDDSVVRDSESRMLMGGSGIANQLVSLYNQAIGAGFVTPELARQIYDAASSVAEQQQQSAQQINQSWDSRIASYAENFMMPQLPSLVGPSIQFRNQGLPGFVPPPERAGAAGELGTGQTVEIDGDEFEVLQ